MIPVTQADVATHLGRVFTSPEEDQVFQWLNWTAGLIKARVDLATLDQDLLGMVLVSVVADLFNNQKGVTSQEVAVDDGRIVTRYRDSATTSLSALLSGWWDTLLPPTGGQAFTIRPYFEPDRRCW